MRGSGSATAQSTEVDECSDQKRNIKYRLLAAHVCFKRMTLRISVTSSMYYRTIAIFCFSLHAYRCSEIVSIMALPL